MIRHPSKAGITRKHSKQIQHDQQSGRPDYTEASAALRNWKRQIWRQPGKQSPPGKQAAEVEQQQREGMFDVRWPEDRGKRGGDRTYFLVATVTEQIGARVRSNICHV